jgi:lysine 2,3-aminomutase
MKSLRGFTTGYAVPQFVVDAPGGGGKVPLNPDTILGTTEGVVTVENYEGKVFEYPEVRRKAQQIDDV